ncbi:MAG: hypothetical protein RL122_2063 [Pseudomonadota bacterium]
MVGTTVRKGLATISLVFLSLISLQSYSAPINGVAAADTTLSKVLLMATLNNGPAMKPYTWTVYRLDNGKSVLETSLTRHSANIELAPGLYRADVTSEDGTVSRSRTFDLRTVSSSDVIIAMD